MNVLVTGASGFLGGNLVRALTRKACHITALLRPTSDVRRIASVLPEIDCHRIGSTSVEDVAEKACATVVIHTATSYGRSGETQSDIAAANVDFPLHLLETSARFGAHTFVNADTFSTKGVELPAGLEQYTLSKKRFRELGEAAAKALGMRFVTLQIEQMYGPDDNPTKFVPWLLHTLLTNQPRCELTAGEQQRDFVHVDDVVNAFLSVIDRHANLPLAAHRLEVGTGSSTTLRAFVELARELSESRTELVFGALPYRAGELMRSEANIAPLRELGWSPRIAVCDGLEQTIRATRATLPDGLASIGARTAEGRIAPAVNQAAGRQ